MRKTLIILVSLLALAWLAGCEKDPAFDPADDDDDDGAADGDTDADSDGDSDADADTDADGDTDADSDGDADADADSDSDPECVDQDSDWWCLPLDCDDDDPDVNPGVPEILGNGVDDNCNGATDEVSIIDPCEIAMANKYSIGCEYWAVDMDNTTPGQPYAIVVANRDATAAHVVVERKSGGVWQVQQETDVAYQQTHVFLLGNTTQAGTYHLANQAFRVTSDLPVVAYQFNPYSGLSADNSDVCTNDGTLLLASSGLDQYYYVLGFSNNTGNGSANIIATADDTQVTIRPSTSISAGGSLPAMSAGVDYTYTMQEASVIQLNASSGDISGTYIEATKPVAVFGGNTCAQVPTGVTYCDHIEHQLFPITTWGQEFVAARTVIRSTNTTPENDYWRVVASENGTTIQTVPAVAGLNGVTMNAGQVLQVGVNYAFTIAASAPIMVGQYLAGHGATNVDFYGAGGDPAMALLPPIEQFLDSYVFLAPEKYLLDYVVITHPSGLAVNLDNTPVSSNPACATETLNANWQITRCLIPDFTHTVAADQPVGITVWGYGGRVSYGYTGGLNMATINPWVE
jgi:hypothetical protein